MADPTITIAPPTRKRRLGGLFAIDDVLREGEGGRLFAATNVQYVSEPCGTDLNEIGFCYGDPSLDPEAEKTLADISSSLGAVPTFAGQYGVECFIGPDDDKERRAREAFEQMEGRFVEAQLQAKVFDDLTATGAAGTPEDVFAAAEAAADRDYIGRPIFHVGRATAVELKKAGVIEGPDDGSGALWTLLGNPVAASGRYTEGRVVVTGWITVVPSDTVVSEGFNFERNRNMVIAERAFAAAIDCDYAVRYDLA